MSAPRPGLRPLRLVALFLLFFAVVPAAPFTRDLGHNLIYHRVQSAADLPAASPARRQPVVLDLRYARGNAADAAALHAWIKAHAAPRAPVFILANAGTDRLLLVPLGPRESKENVLLIGAPAAGFSPDIAVQTTPEAERSAYDAFGAGADLASVVAENADKIRNDEASLSHPAADAVPEPAAGSAKSRPLAPPVDAALQRAVHLHQTLVALKRL